MLNRREEGGEPEKKMLEEKKMMEKMSLEEMPEETLE